MLQTSLFPVQTGTPPDSAAQSPLSLIRLSSRTERILSLRSKALLVGCNYTETKFALRGCINDVQHMERMLTEAYGMHSNSITTMTVRYTSPSADSGIVAQSISKSIRAQSVGQPLFPEALLHSSNTLLLCQVSFHPVQDKEGWRAHDAPTGENIKASVP